MLMLYNKFCLNQDLVSDDDTKNLQENDAITMDCGTINGSKYSTDKFFNRNSVSFNEIYKTKIRVFIKGIFKKNIK